MSLYRLYSNLIMLSSIVGAFIGVYIAVDKYYDTHISYNINNISNIKYITSIKYNSEFYNVIIKILLISGEIIGKMICGAIAGTAIGITAPLACPCVVAKILLDSYQHKN